ncbi:hypothetical protein SAMN03080594_102625 [Arenibacter palladensis]|uniref:Uncharacterized protein n=1 Tax=Arenibacter palladensis TaxID=237373 RepID=A0A1M4YYB1_9FLAO|nr:hypothetical protein SAMN03080594_102625 [Arenibacter palladensis]
MAKNSLQKCNNMLSVAISESKGVVKILITINLLVH